MQSTFSQPQLAVPIRDRIRLSVVGKQACVSFALALLKWCLPRTRQRPVVRIGMISSYGMFLAWARSHVLQERGETALPEPAIANRYPSPAVFFVAAAAFAIAPVLNGLPRPVPVRPYELPVFVQHPVAVLPEKASAALGVSAPQVNRHHRNDVPAVASAEPACSGSGSYSGRSLDYNEVVEAAPVQVKFSGHNAVVLVTRRLSENLSPEAQQREGSFRGIPLGDGLIEHHSLLHFNPKIA